MPRRPRGEKHSAHVIGAPVMGALIAMGKIEDVTDKTPNRAKGGKVEKKRAEKLSKAERSIIARDAAIRRWSKRDYVFFHAAQPRDRALRYMIPEFIIALAIGLVTGFILGYGVRAIISYR